MTPHERHLKLVPPLEREALEAPPDPPRRTPARGSAWPALLALLIFAVSLTIWALTPPTHGSGGGPSYGYCASDSC